MIARPISGSAISRPTATARALVADVVDQVGEEGDRAGGREDEGLGEGGDAEHEQRERDGADARARALDRVVHEPVTVPVTVAVLLRVRVRAHGADPVVTSGSSRAAGGCTCSRWWRTAASRSRR